MNRPSNLIIDELTFGPNADRDQRSGSDLFIQAKDCNAASETKGFEKFGELHGFALYFINNVKKDTSNSATTGGTISSGFVEIKVLSNIFAGELQKLGLSAKGIENITVVKTVIINNERKAVQELKLGQCNIVETIERLERCTKFKFSFNTLESVYHNYNKASEKEGEFTYSYDVKTGEVK
ncbi:MAG: hypothetical protein H6845_02140 [Alphaproteobacteria bacterium]|nr:MAG: hypothetical protein H6845_02140 [Alphaproteobacteria bacterium]